MCNIVLVLVMFLIMAPNGALAVQPDEILADSKLEARARGLSAELRCLVCQNQSIDDSDAPLAKDLRVLVRERLTAGDSDRQVLDFVLVRYGEFVLLSPVFGVHTLFLWFLPPVLLVFAVFVLFRAYRQRAMAGEGAGGGALSEAEKARLDDILGNEGSD